MDKEKRERRQNLPNLASLPIYSLCIIYQDFSLFLSFNQRLKMISAIEHRYPVFGAAALALMLKRKKTK
jgi:hypothetical protein